MEVKDESRLDFNRFKCKRGNDLIEMRKDILSTFQYLTKTELRPHSLPHHICVLKNLEDRKFHKSFNMLLDLFVDNEDVEAADNSGFAQKLKNSEYVLEVLKDTLIEAEIAEGDKDIVKKCKILAAGAHRILNIALGNDSQSGVSHFSGKGWFWLVRRLLEITLDVAETIKIDGMEREAVQKYMLAKFLLEIYPDDKPERAEMLLKKSRHMTLGMDHWKLDEDEGDNEKTLNSCICWLMADMYMDMSKKHVDDLNFALEICTKAVKRAKESQSTKKLCEALSNRGLCYLTMENFKASENDFLRVLCFQEKAENIDGICEAHVSLALVYQKLNKFHIAREHLEEIKTVAHYRGFKLWESISCWRLGELLMMENLFEESGDNFQLAYEHFGGVLTAFKRETHIILDEPFSKFRATPRKTVYGGFGRKSSIKFDITDMKDKIMKHGETVGFLYIHGPSKPPVKMFPSEYRTKTRESMFFLDGSTTEDSLFAALTDERKSKRISRRQRSHDLKTYFLDDNNPADPSMNTYVNSSNVDELNLTRCQYGIARAHQYMNIFFEELEKCQNSIRAKQRIINWKLDAQPFWENREQSEEKFLPEREKIDVSGEYDFQWSDVQLSIKTENNPSGNRKM